MDYLSHYTVMLIVSPYIRTCKGTSTPLDVCVCVCACVSVCGTVCVGVCVCVSDIQRDSACEYVFGAIVD